MDTEQPQHETFKKSIRTKKTIVLGALVLVAFIAFAVAFGIFKLVLSNPEKALTEDFEAVKSLTVQNWKDYISEGSCDSIDAKTQDILGDMDLSESLDMSDIPKGSYDDVAVIFKKFFDFDYEVTSTKVEGNTASLTVEFKTYDYTSAYQSLISDMDWYTVGMSKKKAYKALYKSWAELEKGLTEKTQTATGVITMTKKGGKWKLDALSEKASDAMLGGFTTAISNNSES